MDGVANLLFELGENTQVESTPKPIRYLHMRTCKCSTMATPCMHMSSMAAMLLRHERVAAQALTDPRSAARSYLPGVRAAVPPTWCCFQSKFQK